PTVDAVRTAATVLNLINLSRFDRLFARLDYARKIVRMNSIDEGPVLQLLSCLTEILQGLSVQKLHFAHGTGHSHEPGNVVDDLPPGEFSRTQGFLSALAILDVYTRSIPFEDPAPFILQRIAANQEPSIGTVETANASFGI